MMQLEDWLDDLCVRFLLNIPQEELASVERICFQVEEAQWYFEDFVRPLDTSLPHLDLRNFSLRIFQHCPLFSQWTTQNYQTAFAEFMKYKQRVPVRGAIMLNDDMDEVVLVKGWKKSAAWSFPRGKINKDEDDLDCAIREVWEETGLDLRKAGLVPDHSEAKSIDITMREQNMKLFIFRGIPKDTEFEAKTRKEISKIEWYKLDDLPTYKKAKKHHLDGEDEGPAANAYRFYMVTPFVGHLRKWIAQQKKKGNRYSSHLSAPPLVAEDSEVEALPQSIPQEMQRPQTASDLPEVSKAHLTDQAAQLKSMFNVGPASQPIPSVPQPQTAHMPQVDAAKSNALLSLLRNGPAAEMRASPQTPFEQMSFPSQAPRSPRRSHVSNHPDAVLSPPPQFHVQSELPTHFPLPYHGPVQYDSQLQLQSTGVQPQPPVLTSHRQSLLDAFKGPTFSPPPPPPAPPPSSAIPNLDNHKQSLLDAFRSPALPPATTAKETVNEDNTKPASNGGPSALFEQSAKLPVVPTQNAAIDPKETLLQLFGKGIAPTPGHITSVPAELAATPAEHQALVSQQIAPEESNNRRSIPTLREGETSAIMAGPLDQPNFEAVARKQKEAANSMGRSPLTKHRKLYDPNEPTPVKILSRPKTPKGSKSPVLQPAQAKVSSSPRRTPKATKNDKKEQPKVPFQPRILQRPKEQIVNHSAPGDSSSAMSRGNSSEVDKSLAVRQLSLTDDSGAPRDLLPLSLKNDQRTNPKMATEPRAVQTDPHRQTLLSLFGGGMPRPAANKASQQSSRVVSPLSTSQILSPREEVPVSAVDPISTRSRMSSLASLAGTSATRTTAPENKSFLLNYLGRMASDG